MKKMFENKKELILLLVLIIITTIPLLTAHIFYEGDVAFHMNRLIGIGDAIRDGQFIPRIYPYTNNGYGYANPLFYCDLFLYPFAILPMLGIPLVISYKVMIGFYNALGLILMFVVAKKILNNKASNYALIVYALHGYRFIALYVRNALGEFLGLTFIPLILYYFYKLFKEHQSSYVGLTISMAMVLLAHNLTFVLVCLMYAVLTVIYIIVYRNDKEKIKNLISTTLKAAVLGFLLTCWYTLPMLEQFNDQLFNVNLFGDLANIANTLVGLNTFIPSVIKLDAEGGFGMLEINRYGLNIFTTLLPIILLFNKNAPRYIKVMSVLMAVFIAVSMGIIPLHWIDFFNVLQFSFRWNILIFALCIIPTALAIKNNKYLATVVIVYLVFNISYISYQIMTEDTKIIDNYAVKEEIYDISKTDRTHNNIEIVGAEYLPPTEKNNYITDTKYIKLVENGLYEDIIYEFDRYFTQFNFDYNSIEEDLLMLPLTYYKGYSVIAYNEQEQISIEAINVDVYKKVGFYTLVGDYSYRVRYAGTLIQTISALISGTTLIILLLIRGIRYYKESKSAIK